jgi:hypothetical protein
VGYIMPQLCTVMCSIESFGTLVKRADQCRQALGGEVQGRSVPELVSKLDDEPLTHLMLGHRELFHSNLLAWFFEKFKPMTRPSVRTSSSRSVKREQGNLDIVLRWSDCAALVLENKVFSLPDERQLTKYSARTSCLSDQASYCLLSLSNPEWHNDCATLAGVEWKWISYSELAKKIAAALPKEDRSYAAETMRHYVRVIELLSALVRQIVVQSNSESVYFDSHVVSNLRGSRLLTPMAKLRAASVARVVDLTLKERGFGETSVASMFTRQTPLIESFESVPLGKGAEAGWQVQGSQFRLALKLPHLSGRLQSDVERRNEIARNKPELFDFSPLDPILGTAAVSPRPVKKEFGKFDPDFVYRYKSVPGLTVAQLTEAAVMLAQRRASI